MIARICRSREAKAVIRRRQGATFKQIAAEFRVSASRIQQLCETAKGHSWRRSRCGECGLPLITRAEAFRGVCGLCIGKWAREFGESPKP